MNHVHDLYLGKFLEQYRAYNVNTELYLLYLNKKLQISTYRERDILSTRTKIITKNADAECRPRQITIPRIKHQI